MYYGFVDMSNDVSLRSERGVLCPFCGFQCSD